LPSGVPSSIPSTVPSNAPSSIPSIVPSNIPSTIPTQIPSAMPSEVPSSKPSDIPSAVPSDIPSKVPSYIPSVAPSTIPSVLPSHVPSGVPSSIPSTVPSNAPSSKCAIIDVISNNVEEFKNKLCEALQAAVGSLFSSCDVFIDEDCGIILTYVEQPNPDLTLTLTLTRDQVTVDTSNQVVSLYTQDFVVKVVSEVTSTDYNLVVLKRTEGPSEIPSTIHSAKPSEVPP